MYRLYKIFQFKIYWYFIQIITLTIRVKNTYHDMACLPISTLKCTIAYNQYGGYCIPQSSSYRAEAQSILLGKVYEPKTIEYLLTHCGDVEIKILFMQVLFLVIFYQPYQEELARTHLFGLLNLIQKIFAAQELH
ncbi:hypothetical protein [Candidatus Nitrosacidococcus sp. I8]|uniref:hypothetical protein n=1 Tax=Candidatus Nitrosacidococcus sp. I8 TaxID=2942908 RepID=UPI002226A541|nr:hypothetical protein [Candidatus Nitrosacidococcus sp. I8]CAH9018420.1 hypothetical protein NURINAE_00913 [Candidatus Nitrosacidococcus sp. I8]